MIARFFHMQLTTLCKVKAFLNQKQMGNPGFEEDPPISVGNSEARNLNGAIEILEGSYKIQNSYSGIIFDFFLLLNSSINTTIVS